jgi:hypothetical protein
MTPDHLGLVSPGYVLGLEEVLSERRLGFCVRGDFGVELRPVRNPRFFEHPRSTRYSKKDTSKIRSNGPLPPSNRCRAFTRNDLLGRHQARNDDFSTVRYTEPPGIKPLLTRVGYQVQFYSVPGRRCGVQRAETLTGPWATLATVTAPTTGLIVYDDLNPISTGAFYRLSTP